MPPAVMFTLGSKCDCTLGYEGNIDEFRAYDVELGSADIALLCQPAGTVMTWG